MTNGQLLYEGKAKKVFKSDNGTLILEFKDSLTAFNAQKKGQFEGKGRINSQITELIFNFLKNRGIKSHLIERCDELRLRVLDMKMIPLEVVVRNVLAGSLAKKLKKSEGDDLPFPVVEFYFKSDELEDPLLIEDHILALQITDRKRLDEMKKLALDVNSGLKELFAKANLKLVDFKLEMGLGPNGQLLLADEITPDSCRLWDMKTGDKLDKDRFRRDLGSIKEAYEEVLSRLNKAIN